MFRECSVLDLNLCLCCAGMIRSGCSSHRAAKIPRRHGRRNHFVMKTKESAALKFVLMIGILSFFADFTYEGSRSILGPFLAMLGASATAVGVVTGFGELLGYGLRLVSGRMAERTGEFWQITIFGYFVQLLSVPALALTG